MAQQQIPSGSLRRITRCNNSSELSHLHWWKPLLQKGGTVGLPMTRVSCSSTSAGVGPMKMKKSRMPPTALYRIVFPVAATSMPLLFNSKMPLAVPSAVRGGS